MSSNIRGDNQLLTIDLTNPDFQTQDGKAVPRGSVYLSRRIFLCENTVYEKVIIESFLRSVTLPLQVSYALDADFVGIFEVRGYERKQKGKKEDLFWQDGKAEISYQGLDKINRRSRISFDPAPSSTEGRTATFALQLQGLEKRVLHLCYDFEYPEDPGIVSSQLNPRERYEIMQKKIADDFDAFKNTNCRIECSNEQFNDWLSRSYSDVHMLLSQTPHGAYPYAGVPWFSTTFGRDGLITALQTLWVNPEISRGVLSFLAATQAREVNVEKDSEPGKILHEARKGEMAILNEIPFREYYGSVDSTPLFVVLAGEYFRATGDIAFIHSIWENIEAALAWIDEYGDRDKDGFIEYFRSSGDGLINQGWKDSHDSVFHADGSFASGPIALAEVQGYVYQAKRLAAQLAMALNKKDLGQKLSEQALILKDRFHQQFWCEDLGTYALALDGQKRPCRVRSSNPGHCLYSGIVQEDVASRLIDTLMSDSMFCGWGIRTVAEGEARYNPMSYHNGSIWPHDNSLIAMGFANYGRKDCAAKLLTSFFDVSLFLDLNRLPELFCGFNRQTGEGPTLYPLSCAPQAWAAATVFLLIQACLGLRLDAVEGRIVFESPRLPESIKFFRIMDLKLGTAGAVDLEIVRHGYDVGVNILERRGNVSVIVQK